MRWLTLVLVPSISILACSAGCSTSGSNPPPGGDSGSPSALVADKIDYCKSCTPIASATACNAAKPVSACCVCTAKPTAELVRATGLVYNSAPNNDPNVDLSCLDAPKPQGTPMMVTLTGFVKLFSSGDDTAGVKIEIFKEGANGALGDPVGTATTTTMDPVQMPKPTLLMGCTNGCSYRGFNVPNVPTETPLIIKTSDALGAQKWATLYDYNIYFANDSLKSGMAYYEPSAVGASDPNTVAGAAGGRTIKSDKGLLAGEVHDCADVRLGNAMVNTDVPPEGDIFYFSENEANPLPSTTATSTSKLGVFGAFNYPTGTPIRIAATGVYKGKITLIGTYTVQTFPKAVTALSLRGRRPFQK